jgi:hypothetical protein
MNPFGNNMLGHNNNQNMILPNNYNPNMQQVAYIEEKEEEVLYTFNKYKITKDYRLIFNNKNYINKVDSMVMVTSADEDTYHCTITSYREDHFESRGDFFNKTSKKKMSDIEYKQLKSVNKTYDDKSFGGSNNGSYSFLLAVRRF